MKVLIVGAGALGSLVGALLDPAHDVRLLGRGEHIRTIASEGLRVEGLTRSHIHPPVAEIPEAITSPPDLMVFTVKAYDTKAAARATIDLCGHNTLVLTLQNGLGNVEILQETFGREHVLAGVTSMGAHRTAPGRIVHAGAGRTIIGRPVGAPDGAVKRLARILNGSFPVEIGGDMRGEIHLKALANAAINPLTAIHRIRNGEILRHPDLMRRMDAVIEESLAVYSAAGIGFPVSDPRSFVYGVVRGTAENRSSMLQDVERGHRTEIDQINGAIAVMGRKHGIPTPENDSLVEAIHLIENSVVQ